MIKNKALAQILKNQYLILYHLRHCESCKNLMEDINEITDKALMKTEYFTDKLLHRRRTRKKHFLEWGDKLLIKEQDWVDFYGNNTKALYLEKEGQYTISEFIELLQAAKERFGDKTILIHDMNDDIIGGFSHVYLNKDNICIYG